MRKCLTTETKVLSVKYLLILSTAWVNEIERHKKWRGKVEHYRGVIITNVMVFSWDPKMKEKFDNSFKNGESLTRELYPDMENKSFPPFLLGRFAWKLICETFIRRMWLTKFCCMWLQNETFFSKFDQLLSGKTNQMKQNKRKKMGK